MTRIEKARRALAGIPSDGAAEDELKAGGWLEPGAIDLAEARDLARRELEEAEADSEATSFHITSTRNGSLYGHATDHCDEGGCNGVERFLGAAVEGVSKGDIWAAPRVVGYDSNETLEGTASAELIKESRAVETGAVGAYRDDAGVWQYVAQDREDFVRTHDRREVVTVWIEE
jgi:hypothetical protein